MNLQLREQWARLRASYWFVPTLMTIVAIALSFLFVALDESALEQEALATIPGIYNGSPEGARELLATVASSMITVAGVVFSITIVALTLASQQFGPRLLSNFMKDTSNQIVLGTFVATFIYCLLTLRSVRGIEDATFVPHIAVTFAVVLATAGIGVLIYFIHHVSTSIHILTVVEVVAKELDGAVERLFPARIGEPPEGAESDSREDAPARFRALTQQPADGVSAPENGYITAVDPDRLLEIATEYDLVLELHHRPGHFAVRDELRLASVWPAGRLNEEVEERIQDAFLFGSRRSPEQDLLFVIDQLVEMAVRALSPGINDPFTAISCIDWLGAGLCKLARRDLPHPFRHDDEGRLRVVAYSITFEEAVESAFGQIRHYGRDDATVMRRLRETVRRVAACRAPAPEKEKPLFEALMARIERAATAAEADAAR